MGAKPTKTNTKYPLESTPTPKPHSSLQNIQKSAKQMFSLWTKKITVRQGDDSNHPFIGIPRDVILFMLANYVPDHQLGALCQVSLSTRSLVMDEQVWRQKLESITNHMKIEPKSENSSDIRSEYILAVNPFLWAPEKSLHGAYQFENHDTRATAISNRDWTTVGTKNSLRKGNVWRLIAGIYQENAKTPGRFPFSNGLIGAVENSFGIVSHTGRMVSHQGGGLVAVESASGTKWCNDQDTVSILVDTHRGNMVTWVNDKFNLWVLKNFTLLSTEYKNFYFGFSWAREGSTIDIESALPSSRQRSACEEEYFKLLEE